METLPERQSTSDFRAVPALLGKIPPWLRLGLIFPLIFLNGWLISLLINYLEPLLSILITASLLAFLLDFPILFLQKQGIPRKLAIALVLLLGLLVLVLLGLTLIPSIVQQLSDLVENLPVWIETGSQHVQTIQKWAIAQKLSIDLGDIVAQAAARVSNALRTLTSQLLSVLLSTINSLVNILLILGLAVFLVLTGESVWRGIFSWLPSPWDGRLRESIRQTFEAYFATQAILAGILSITQTIVFLLLDVPYAILFGFAIGMTTLIPYASTVTIAVISLLLALQNLQLGIKVLVAAIVIGQINDSVVAPRLMGGMTGLNPVWIIISLFIGGKLGGILGLLIAVPTASVIKSTTDTLRSPHSE
ncbi:MAG: AI-2E family transporter [Hydrococcus sp. C42_A2020_068]|nr:AI-2E family transporter [Hydrococcus sp. C42_A2020_068]